MNPILAHLRACLALAALAFLPLAAAAESTSFHYSGQLEADASLLMATTTLSSP